MFDPSTLNAIFSRNTKPVLQFWLEWHSVSSPLSEMYWFYVTVLLEDKQLNKIAIFKKKALKTTLVVELIHLEM